MRRNQRVIVKITKRITKNIATAYGLKTQQNNQKLPKIQSIKLPIFGYVQKSMKYWLHKKVSKKTHHYQGLSFILNLTDLIMIST